MLTVRSRRVLAAALFILTIGAGAAAAQTAAKPGALRVYSTIYSAGVEWDLAGDTDHDATASVAFRVADTSQWVAALPLVRVDDGTRNMVAGSIFFLHPATRYEVRLTLSDPSGGGATRTEWIATRPLPTMPAGGRTFHVVPGKGGGDGSAADPFRGVPAAQAVASAGDIFLLHAGEYGGRIRFDRPGAPSTHIVWKGAGDGEVLMNGIDIAASHIWLEGLTVRNQSYATFSIGAPQDVVVTRCRFFNNNYSIYLQQGGAAWYIADNTIVGTRHYSTGSFDGEGIELNTTSGHTVAHNSVTNTADAISYPLANVDIFGNDIFDTSDDGIEVDFGGTNVRIWGNRIHNARHNGISFQPQSGAPVYILRNQIVGNVEGPFKFRTTDRFVLLHNTIVNWGTAWPGDKFMCCNDAHLLRSISRNNLWVAVQGGQVWGFGAERRDWRSDLDFDGFDWGAAPNPFSYGGATQADLASFAAASALQVNGRRVSKDTCFETFDVPTPPPSPVPPQVMSLHGSCPAVDAGQLLPNVNDRAFAGVAPDMGAHERDGIAARYGPRSAPAATLTATPSSITAGQTSTLAWTTTGADVVALHPLGHVAPNGTMTVSPAGTTVYTLTATAGDAAATATATVVVNDAPAPLAAPTGLVATAVSAKQVNLSWTDNSTGEDGFIIERAANGISFAQLATVGAGAVTYADTSAKPGKTYHYRVRAYRQGVTSGDSNVAAVTTPKR